MGCCVLDYSNNKMMVENLDILIPSTKMHNPNKYKSDKNNLYSDISNKEESHNSTIFPSGLIKSKENPNGIVIIKLKNYKSSNLSLI